MAGNSTEPGQSVTSRVAAILLTFTDCDERSLTEIARLAGLPVSTAHRLAVELASRDLLERDGDGHYHVGSPLRGVGHIRVGAPHSQNEHRVFSTTCPVPSTGPPASVCFQAVRSATWRSDHIIR